MRQTDIASAEIVQKSVFRALEAMWTKGEAEAPAIAGAGDSCFAADVAKYIQPCAPLVCQSASRTRRDRNGWTLPIRFQTDYLLRTAPPMHLLESLAFVPKRLFRLTIPITLLLLLSSGFTFLFVLYHPRTPGRVQRLGWQSWDVVNGDPSLPYDTPTGSGNTTEGKEWWELDELDAGETPASVSLPLDVWAPLLRMCECRVS